MGTNPTGAGTPGEAAQAVKEEDLEQLGFSFYSREEQIRIWGLEKWEQYEEKCGQAAEGTAGQVLSLGGDAGLPEDVPYHAVSAGRTRDGEAFGEPYSWLTPVECPDDLHASEYLKIQNLELETVPEILSRDEAGYALEVRLGGKLLGGEEFRSLYGLNSSNFSAQRWEEGVRITTKGLGHGLGMSLYQANLLALDGKQYQEILQYFYKNAACISFS